MKLVKEVKVWLVGAPSIAGLFLLGELIFKGAGISPEPFGFLCFLFGGLLMTAALVGVMALVAVTLVLLWDRFGLTGKAAALGEWVGRDD